MDSSFTAYLYDGSTCRSNDIDSRKGPCGGRPGLGDQLTRLCATPQ